MIDSSFNPDHYSVAGKTIAITGAAGGMGRIFATHLAQEGANVVISDLNDQVHTTAEEITNELSGENVGKVVSCIVDVTNAEEHEKMAELALSEFGQLDGWINNAGVFPQAASLDITPQQIDLSLKVNVNGTLFGAQAAARHFQKNGGGSIVNMASVAALRVRKSRGAYNAAKAAALHLTNSLATELGPDNIRVNAIAPGFIETAMTQWIYEEEGAYDKAMASIPLTRLGKPKEVYSAVRFLLTDAASYVNGSCISVDGGSRHL